MTISIKGAHNLNRVVVLGCASTMIERRLLRNSLLQKLFTVSGIIDAESDRRSVKVQLRDEKQHTESSP